MVLVSFLSFVNYENSTKPTGIYCETGYYGGGVGIPGSFRIYNLKSYSFLGSSISVGYITALRPP